MTEQKRYRAMVGLSYPATPKDVAMRKSGKDCAIREVEAGEVVSDIPPESIRWLLEGGFIQVVD